MRSPIPSDECARACEWASLRLDDQLSEFEEVLLEAHLVRCADCRAFAASISDLTGALRASPLEQATFAFEAPRQTRGRTFALRAVSAAAAVAVVGVSGLVSLQVSTTRSRPGTPLIGPKVMSLKERQMNDLTDMTTTRKAISRGLAAAEQVIVGDRPVPAASSTVREIPAQ